jgi:hypothetical protein
MTENIEVDDFVELTFEGEFGNQSPIKGRVLEVDEEPEVRATSLVVVVNDAPGERELIYGEGKLDGEPWSNVTVKNSPIKLGENASIRTLK